MRDMRFLARDILALKKIYPDRLDDGGKRIFFDPKGDVVCVNRVPIGADGYTLNGRYIQEITILMKIADDYPITLPGETHQPVFGLPQGLRFKGGRVGFHYHESSTGEFADKNWVWLCLLFGGQRPTQRSLMQSVLLVVRRMQLFARNGR